MKLLLLLLGILLFILGGVLTVTVIGAVFGVPLILIGLVIFLLGIILPIRL